MRRALASDAPVVRARAFDVLYNMAIHGELLLPNEASLLAEELQARLVSHIAEQLLAGRAAWLSHRCWPHCQLAHCSLPIFARIARLFTICPHGQLAAAAK